MIVRRLSCHGGQGLFCPTHRIIFVQRGHNRSAVFIEDCDYQYYLDNLREWKERLELRVYSYCLMTNHVHLIVGSLWESRFKISPIETEPYLLQCCRYVELNPVKAGIVKQPEAYRWSSFRTKVGLANEEWLDLDECYQALASSLLEKQARYCEFINDTASASQTATFIRHTTERNQLTGNSRFIDEVAKRIGKRIEHRAPGRPIKAEGVN